MAAPLPIRQYDGPECPRCHAHLTADWIRSGIVHCPDCSKTFEATAFTPPQPKLRVVEVIHTGPEGASACANHARNAAVTNCTRCGLFICALCDMNVGSGSYCPSCFDRVRADGSVAAVATHYRDYSMMARNAAIFGVILSGLFLSLPLGIAAIVYARKARAQRREMGESTTGPTVAMIFGILEVIGGAIIIGFLLWSLFRTTGK